jgi:hypothetical protein
MTAAAILLYVLALYAAAGLCTAAAFVWLGVGRVLPHPEGSEPMSFSPGARLILIPGAAVLWPYVLVRWRSAARHGG